MVTFDFSETPIPEADMTPEKLVCTRKELNTRGFLRKRWLKS